MAAMFSSCTFLSRAPTPVPAPARLLSPAAALQLRKQPPAAASVVALPWAASRKESQSRRAPLFVCHAKYNYGGIQQPDALENPTAENHDWSIMKDKDQLIILKLKVGEDTSKDQLQVERTDDLASLIIRYTGGDSSEDDSPASSLNLRLKVPRGYDGRKVKAKMFKGWLIIAIAKATTTHDPNQIFFYNGSFYYDANKIAID